jgi:hypothetical protein
LIHWDWPILKDNTDREFLLFCKELVEELEDEMDEMGPQETTDVAGVDG